MRLSREAVLAEIQIAHSERDQAYESIDYVLNAEHYSPTHQQILDGAHAIIDKCDKRLAELQAMLKDV